MTSGAHVTIGTAALRDLALAAWRACGGSIASGQAVVSATLEAQAAGRVAVGFDHYVDYLDALREGRIDGTAEPLVEQPLTALVRCDARNGVAQYAYDLAFERLVAATRACGVGVFTLKNSYTAGEMGHYVRLLARAGLLGMVFANSHAMVAPGPGTGVTYGTNPMAFAAPRPAPHPPLLFDQASSATAYLNIDRALKEGRDIPEGWALDAEGVPTCKPQAAMAGALLPFGGTKGANMALLVEVMAAALAGGQWSVDAGHFRQGTVPPGIGMTVIALEPGLADPGMIDRLDTGLDGLAAAGVHVPGARAPHVLPGTFEIGAQTLAIIRAHAARSA